MRTLKIFGWIGICFVLLVTCGRASASPFVHTMEQEIQKMPQAAQGIMDASKWDFEKNGILKLNGQWAFYWNELIDPDRFLQGQAPPPMNVEVPDSWTNYVQDGRTLSNKGYATYRLQIRLPESESHQLKAIYMDGVASAYKLWVNGELVLSQGTVGRTFEEMVPFQSAQVGSFLPKQSELDIVIQVSSFVQRKAGLWENIELGQADQITDKRVKRVAFEVFLAGSLLVIGFYYCLFYVQRRQAQSALFYGLTCMGVGVRSLFLGQTLAVYFLPQIPWVAAVKIEYISAYFAILCFTLFFQNQFPHERQRLLGHLTIGIHIILILVVLFTPAYIYTHILTYYLWIVLIVFMNWLYIVFRAIRRRREGALFQLLSALILIPCIIIEIFYYVELFGFADLVSLGMFISLILQGIWLARAFSKSYGQVQKLSHELSLWNQTLEQKIRLRTVELEQSNQELLQVNGHLCHLEQSLRHLLSDISHELGTPLTSIQGYIKAMMDGVIAPGHPKYMKMIFEKTVVMDRLIGDLFELSKLEAKQITFNFQQVMMIPYMQKLYDKFKLDLAGYDYKLIFKLDAGLDESCTVEIDPVRMEQVVANLLNNAKHHTELGQPIHIVVQIKKDEMTVHILDHGSGMDEAEIPFLFDRFYRGTHSRRNKLEGTGLGLFICKEIIQSHGGTIGIDSELGQGSDVHFTIPVSRT